MRLSLIAISLIYFQLSVAGSTRCYIDTNNTKKLESLNLTIFYQRFSLIPDVLQEGKLNDALAMLTESIGELSKISNENTDDLNFKNRKFFSLLHETYLALNTFNNAFQILANQNITSRAFAERIKRLADNCLELANSHDDALLSGSLSLHARDLKPLKLSSIGNILNLYRDLEIDLNNEVALRSSELKIVIAKMAELNRKQLSNQ